MAAQKRQKDFSFALDTRGGVPFYRQIILQVQMAIADGRLEPGTKLPTVRGLAVELEINPNTVARAYNELEIRGLVSTQQGSGTFISDQEVELSGEERAAVLDRLLRNFLSSAAGYGFSKEEVRAALESSAEENPDHGTFDTGGEP